MGEYRMPSLGADMESGTLVRWLVGPGDQVHRGDVVATIETEKSTIDAEVFEEGVVEALLVQEGEKVPVGTPLATLAAPGAPAAPAKAPVRARRRPAVAEETAPARPGAPAAAVVTPPPRGSSGAGTERVHSPVVRRLAESLGVDLALLGGSGPGGAITREDVQAAYAARAAPKRRARAAPFTRRRADELGIDLSSIEGTGPGGIVTPADLEQAAGLLRAPGLPAAAPVPEEAPPGRRDAEASAPRGPREAQRALRRQIGRLMSRSKREIPHYYLATTIDLSAAVSWLEEHNRAHPPERRLLPAALLFKATALAVREVPEMNGFFVDDELEVSEAVHLGVAIALRQGGLVAPAIHHADRLPLDAVMAATKDLIARARAGRLRASEMADPTLTVTNLGDRGVETVFGVIYPPQVALVGFGKLMERPFARDGLVGARPSVVATLSADHRASDGHRGALFLAGLDRLLQAPERL